MLLKCEVVIHNRLAPALESRKSFVTFRFSKEKNKSGVVEIYFNLHSAKNKSGSKYKIKGNIANVHSRFVEEGKSTVGMKEPPHNLIISKAKPTELKDFLKILKVAFNGEDVSSLINLDNEIKLRYCDLEKPKSSMTIASRGDYPMRESFPSSLENLSISCSLKKFDERILKLIYLKVLDLSHNKLSTLSVSLDDLVNLRNVHLDHNCFQEFPSSLCTGKTSKRIGLLDLSDNKIRYLPLKFSNMTNLYTLQLDRNEIEFLPSNVGYMRNLKCLHMNCNKLKILPWSFTLLQLDVLDISGNLFDDESAIQFNDISLCNVPSLFEITARFVVSKRIKDFHRILPRIIHNRLESCRFCQCGKPCITHCVPYVKQLNLSQVAQSITYDPYLLSNKATINVIGYLCSKRCHEKWLDNPNTLFTEKKRKRIPSS